LEICYDRAMSRWIGWSLVLLAVWTWGQSGNLTGRVSVTDGDTLEIQGVRVRLYGVDAPESSQPCLDGKGQVYRCGQVSANRLAQFIGQATVTCTRRDTDRYGRTVATCTVGGQSINDWLVRQGLAVAYLQYGGGIYQAAENEARKAKRGVWAGTFQVPWDYRKSPQALGGKSSASPSSTSGGDRDCGDFATWRQAQDFFKAAGPGDPHRLDQDGDGIACESLPGAP
jgi:endonuclease YncB( thermonuclease family)